MAVNWGALLVYMVMPAVGIGLVAVFVLSFFLPFGGKLEGARQVIKGFGLDVEVSARTLLMLAGLALLFTGVFLQVQQRQVDELNGRIAKLQAQLEVAQEQAAKAGRQTIRGFLELPTGINAAALDLRELECRYVLVANPDQWIEAALSEGLGGNSVRFALNDIGPDDVVQEIQLRKRGSNQVLGEFQNFYPLQPLVKLGSPQ